jgi:hypothetical protein
MLDGMTNREIRRHAESGRRYLVELSAGGAVLGARALAEGEDARSALRGRLISDPEAMSAVTAAGGECLVEYEQDEAGDIWDFVG